MIRFLFLATLFTFVFSSCVSKKKNIVYSSSRNLLLDVYAPKKIEGSKKIFVFVYGGNWRSGKKSYYRFLGKRMARKGLVCVIMNYRLNPTPIAGMADDVAEAVKWTKDNAASIKGDTNHIYISGHSAGGHLAALVATDNSYFEKLNMHNPIHGVVLIDAFGLDMHRYLTESLSKEDSIYTRVFSSDPERWKKLSPINYLNKQSPVFIQLVGDRTYPAIKELNAEFYNRLKKYQPGAPLIIYKRKKHIPMIAQFYNMRTKAYKDVLGFMKE